MHKNLRTLGLVTLTVAATVLSLGLTGAGAATAQGTAKCLGMSSLPGEQLPSGNLWDAGVMPDTKTPALPSLPADAGLPPLPSIDLPSADLGIPAGTKIGMYINCSTTDSYLLTISYLPAPHNKKCVPPGDSAIIVPPTGKEPQKPAETRGC